jgi:diguanylate cyclase (GGDEF)-like protein
VAVAAVLRLVHRAGGGLHRPGRVDLALAAAGVMTVAMAVLGARAKRQLGLPSWHLAIDLGCLVALVVTAFGTAGPAPRRAGPKSGIARLRRGSESERQLFQLEVFAILAVLADVLVAARSGRSVGEMGSLLELAWGAAGVMLAAAACTSRVTPDGSAGPGVRSQPGGPWRRRMGKPSGPPHRPMWHFAGPGAGALSAVAVLVAGQHVNIGSLSAVFASIALVLAGGRAAQLAGERFASKTQADDRTDELTGLATRQSFYERLRQSLAHRHPTETLAVLVIDIDRFKEINDSLGHVSGDELLHHIANRLAQRLEPGAILARLGGDEFGLLLAGDEVRARAAARRLRREMEAPFVVSGLSLRVEASVGIALWPTHGALGERLLARADIAMYRAKSARTGVEVFRFQGDDPSRERLAAIEALRSALPRGEIVLHYQPKIDVRTGESVGVEALASWRRRNGGLVSPTTFIPLAEQAGLMPELTRVVLDAALLQMRRWETRAVHVGSMAVNVSATCLLDPRFPSVVVDALTRHGIPAERLIIEITEDTVVGEPERCERALSILRHAGVRLSLDDYGTGYSSLSMLRQLPLDELKLDRSFGQAADLDPRAGAIVRSTAGLARELGLTLVAEGVETSETMALLRDCGCQVAQGFLFATPLAADDVEEWLVRQKNRRAKARAR